jgi:hypothetical protein
MRRGGAANESAPASRELSASFDRLRGARKALRDESGSAAVDAAEALRYLKTSVAADSSESRLVGGKRFQRVGSVWIDEAYRDGAELVKIRYLGAAYFRLIDLAPEAKSILAQGSQVVWTTPSGKALVISDEGADDLPDEQLRVLFRR